MKQVMFTKHLEGWSIPQIVEGLSSLGLDGADLCTREGYPVSPDNCETAMPDAARQFADKGMSIRIVTTPGDFTDASMEYAERLYAACATSGVKSIKLGYWRLVEPGYWQLLDHCRRKLEAFETLSAKHGVKTVVHNHSGSSMGLNASAAMRLVEGRDPKHVGIFADAGHLSMVGEPFAMAVDICWKYLDCIALKDLVWNTTPGDMRTGRALRVVPFGFGCVEWNVVAEELTKRGFDGTLSFHCEYGDYHHEAVLAQCRADRALFNRLLDQAKTGN
jgi:sugar phosphate isomerase/epimerase